MAKNTKTSKDSSASTVVGEAGKNWGWLLALGISFIALGTIGLGMTATLTLVSVLFFGWLMIFGGIFQFIQAFKLKGWKIVFLQVFIALLYFGAGAVIVYDPVGGAIALTAFIAIAFAAIGLIRIILAFQLKGLPGWWWPLVSGLISITLGILIMSEWPSSSFWVIGLLIAIEMIVNGWTYVLIAPAIRRATKVSS